MKRMTALFLTLILMLGILPMAAFAATTKSYTMLRPFDLSDIEMEDRPDQGFWHQLNVKRKDVKSITFLDSTSSAPRSVWDFSANGDMSVIGWIYGSDSLP